ncbi:MAG: helix-turn-helix domain-containing protein [Actinomycetota bacterium]|nr:helix-turn-helix domain-containing protein [Actinomycetota bacterium]
MGERRASGGRAGGGNGARSGATWDRARTEAALEDAALRLLRRNGVLAGINLREVADEAGVNRGLVYHYFGSRRDLLRAALRRDVRERFDEMLASPQASWVERAKGHIRAVVHQAPAIELVVALVLDRDEKVRILPLHETALADITRRQERGELRADLDVEAMHAYRVAAGYGYALLRERMAAELGIDLDELDRRVTEHAGEAATVALAGPRPPRTGP